MGEGNLCNENEDEKKPSRMATKEAGNGAKQAFSSYSLKERLVAIDLPLPMPWKARPAGPRLNNKKENN